MLAERCGTFYGIRTTAGQVYAAAGDGHHGLRDGGRATPAELSTPCGIASYGKAVLVLDDRIPRVREVAG